MIINHGRTSRQCSIRCLLLKIEAGCVTTLFALLTPEQRGGFRGGRGRGFGARGGRSRGRIYWDLLLGTNWTASHKDLSHSKMDYFLFFFLHWSPRLCRLAHPDLCGCFRRGWGGWGGLVSRRPEHWAQTFYHFTPRVPLGQGGRSCTPKCFFPPFIFKIWLCVFLWNKRLPSCNILSGCRKR